MLKLLRKKGIAKKILWFVAVIIILSFGVFGTAYQLSSRENITSAGKIFGKKTTPEEYASSLRHAESQAILRYGENFDKIRQFLNLESEAWDRLILLHEARKRRIKISNEDVIKTIEGFEFFKKDGKFSADLYAKIIRYVFRSEPRDFEEGVRESLIFAKIYEQETSSLTLLEDETQEEYKKKNEQVQVSYALLAVDNYKNQATSEPNEAEEYYHQHKDEFRLPAAINVEYLTLPYPAPVDAAQKTKLNETMSQAAAELKTDPDFEKTAKKYNLQRAETGFFSREEPNLKMGLPLELLAKAFALKENTISDPLETSRGLFILRLKEKRDAYLPDYAQAAPRVSETLILQKAKETARRQAEQYLKQIKENISSSNKSFAELTKELGLSLQQTQPFSRSQYIPNIGAPAEFQQAAFALSDQNKISEVVETPKGFCILYLDSFIPVDKEKFEKEKEDFKKTILSQKKTEAFSRFVTQLRAKANLEDNISRFKKPL